MVMNTQTKIRNRLNDIFWKSSYLNNIHSLYNEHKQNNKGTDINNLSNSSGI